MALAAVCLSVTGTAQAGNDIVMVANRSMPAQELDKRAVKLAYFGIPQHKSGVDIQPIINAADPDVTSRFLAAALGTTTGQYYENMRRRQFAQGGKLLRETKDMADLVHLLERLPGAVTYMRADQVAQFPDLRVISSLD